MIDSSLDRLSSAIWQWVAVMLAGLGDLCVCGITWSCFGSCHGDRLTTPALNEVAAECVQPRVFVNLAVLFTRCESERAEDTLWPQSVIINIISVFSLLLLLLLLFVRLPEEEYVWSAGLPQSHPALQAGPREIWCLGHADRQRCQGTSYVYILSDTDKNTT